MIELRAQVRKLMREQAFLSDAAVTSWAPVILLDISPCGISFATPAVVLGGELRQLRFRIPGSPELHHAGVRIAHQTSTGVPVGYTVGAKFEEIGADTTKAIMDFVSESPKA